MPFPTLYVPSDHKFCHPLNTCGSLEKGEATQTHTWGQAEGTTDPQIPAEGMAPLAQGELGWECYDWHIPGVSLYPGTC